MRRKAIRLSLALILLAGCVGTHKPTDPPVSKARVRTKWEKETLETLESRKVSFCFVETQLTKVLEFLSDLTGLRMTANLEEGIDPPVTLRVNRMALRHALNWIATLTRMQWGLVVEAEKIYFTPSAEGLLIPDDLHGWDERTRDRYAETLDTEKVSFFFAETQLTRTLSFLAELTELDFIPILEDGVNPPVTLRAKEMKLSKALDWLGSLTGTEWGMRDGAICVYPGDADIATIPPWEWQEGLDTRLNVDFRDQMLPHVFGFLKHRAGVKVLDKVPRGAPRVTLRREDVAVREVLDTLAVMFGTHRYTPSKKGVLFGLKDPLAVPEWKKTLHKTLKEKKISVDFRGIDILKASHETLKKANIETRGMFEDKPYPRVLFRATDMPVENVLDEISAFAGFGWIIRHNAVYPLTPARAASGKESIWATEVRDLDERTARRAGLRDTYGALVVSVPKDSPGHRTGLKKGDVILALGKIRIMDAAEYRRTIPIGPLSKRYRIRILRRGSLMILDLKLK
jgi:hypothetical protein